MKIILISSIFIIAFSFNIFAQEKTVCPIIEVSGGGRPLAYETVLFTVNVDTKGKELKLEYVWSVDNGKIVQGQGTQTITVELSERDGITATVEVKGLPEGCQNIVSDHPIYDPSPEAEKIGKFLNFRTQDEKDSLIKLKASVVDDPNSQIYVIGRFKENTPEQTIRLKEKKFREFLLKKLAVDPGRITIIRVFAEQEYTEIWLVPPGAQNPEIEN